MNERELDELMDRLASGDRDAFEPLYLALWPRAIGAARRRLEPEVATDAAQTAMLRVFARAAEFRAGSPVLPWFYAVVANEVRAAQRGAGKHAPLDEASVVPAADDPERELVDRELREILANAVESLDPQSAQVIAALLGRGERPDVDDVVFRKRVSRAYAKLRILLGAYRER